MERAFPPLSSSISPSPAQQQPPTTTSPYPIFRLLFFIAAIMVTVFTILYGKFIRRRSSPDSRQVNDPDPTPTDTTAAAANALELLKSDLVIIYIDDSPLSSPDTEAAGPSDESSSCCPICCEEVAEGEEVRVLPRCRHAYHRACIDRWLIMGSQSCPVCRVRLTVRWAER